MEIRQGVDTWLDLRVTRLLYGRLHLNLIEYGRAICPARGPRGEAWPLTDVCAYSKSESQVIHRQRYEDASGHARSG